MEIGFGFVLIAGAAFVIVVVGIVLWIVLSGGAERKE
jgi:hypothetical protein